MQRSQIALPPLVEGAARGALRVWLGAPAWNAAAPADLKRRPLVARITFWGDDTAGEVLTLPAAAVDGGGSGGGVPPASVEFELRTGPKYVARYLHDMGCLAISLEAAAPDSSGSSSNGSGTCRPCGSQASTAAAPAQQPPTATLAATSVALAALDAHAPIDGHFPLSLPNAETGAAGAVVGTLLVRLQLEYHTALVSSFELNECLAEHLAEGGAAARTGTAVAAAARPAGAAAGAAAAEDALGAPDVCTQLAAALIDRWGPLACSHIGYLAHYRACIWCTPAHACKRMNVQCPFGGYPFTATPALSLPLSPQGRSGGGDAAGGGRGRPRRRAAAAG